MKSHQAAQPARTDAHQLAVIGRRRSGAAGPHDRRRPRGEERRRSIADARA